MIGRMIMIAGASRSIEIIAVCEATQGDQMHEAADA